MSKTIFTAFLLIITVLAIETASAEKRKGQKVIDFEDEVVEGINKRPLDSFNQLSEAEKRRRRPHLYRKRIGFRTEMEQTLDHMRYVQ